MMIKRECETSKFKIISRDNALSKLLGEKVRYKTCWSTPAQWFTFQGMDRSMHVVLMLETQTFYLETSTMSQLNPYGSQIIEKTV